MLPDQYVLIIYNHSLKEVFSAGHILSQQSLLIVLFFLPTLLIFDNALSTKNGRQRVLTGRVTAIQDRGGLQEGCRW